MLKKITLVIILLFLTSIPVLAASKGLTGSGTTEDPFLIHSFRELELLANEEEGYSLAAYYQLASDIDASPTSNIDYNDGRGWAVIAKGTTEDDTFRGVFDGNGYQISNLYINNLEGTHRIGFFGLLEGEVKNLALVDVQVEGKQAVGILAGQVSEEGLVKNSYATGSVKGENLTGGLVGFNFGGELRDSYFLGNVEGKERTGGLVGNNEYGMIKNSYFEGSVSGELYTGGLAGLNFDERSEIRDSYALGDIKGEDRAGGLTGANSYGLIEDSYFEGSVRGQYLVAGVIGINFGQLVNSYARGEIRGAERVGGLVGNNETEGRIRGSYAEVNLEGNKSVGELVGINFGEIIEVITTGAYKSTEMVLVEAGTTSEENGGVTVEHDFYIARYHVTQGDFEEVMGFNPSEFAGNPNKPVENMTWFDAVKFANKLSEAEGLDEYYDIRNVDYERPDFVEEMWNDLYGDSLSLNIDDAYAEGTIYWARVEENEEANGYRLPTLREHQYAARGGKNGEATTYAGSDDFNQIGWYMSNSDVGYGWQTHPVAQKEANELGLYDMQGNVWDWLGDRMEVRGLSCRPLHGAGYFSRGRDLNFGVILRHLPFYSTSERGFRLARNSKEE